jgi:3-dehydroquinate synthetase
VAAGLRELAPRLTAQPVFVITSPPLRALAAFSMLLEALGSAGAAPQVLEVPDGEAAKAVGEAERLWRQLSALGGRRDSVVVSFGGGAVSDLAGFVAGTFLRGVAWIAVPTTLLAQVDAALGGKTGIDLPEAKNAVGVFHHPLAVLADPGVLATLPADQRRSGLVEVVKVGAILDRELLERVERDLPLLLAGDEGALAPVLAAAARSKLGLVARDPEERGERQLLNFGHTLGHALEAEIGYGRILHGDAVGHGLRFALGLSAEEGGDPAALARVSRLLGRLGLPPLPRLAVDALMERVGRDKKARAGGVGWVLMAGAGEGRIDARLPAERVRAALVDFLGEVAAPPL